MFCLYHVYSNSRDYKWYLIIFLIPLFGCLVYLYFQFVNRQNIDLVSDTVQNVFSGSSKIDKLHKELNFSDTIANRLNLANEYLVVGESKLAKEQYLKCLSGAHKNDKSILTKLLQANYLEKDFNAVVEIGNELKNDVNFKKSNERVAYAFALQEINQLDLAEAEFRQMDTKYSNYFQRYNYAKFLNDIERNEASKEKLQELESEIEQMDRREKRFHDEIIRLIRTARKQGWE